MENLNVNTNQISHETSSTNQSTKNKKIIINQEPDKSNQNKQIDKKLQNETPEFKDTKETSNNTLDPNEYNRSKLNNKNVINENQYLGQPNFNFNNNNNKNNNKNKNQNYKQNKFNNFNNNTGTGQNPMMNNLNYNDYQQWIQQQQLLQNQNLSNFYQGPNFNINVYQQQQFSGNQNFPREFPNQYQYYNQNQNQTQMHFYPQQTPQNYPAEMYYNNMQMPEKGNQGRENK